MRELVILLFVSAGLSCLATGQDHAPTSEQCTADATIWNAELNSGKPTSILLGALELRSEEMRQCAVILTQQTIDSSATMGTGSCRDFVRQQTSEQLRLLGYERLFAMYRKEITVRLYAYLKRHGLTSQVAAEDADGQR